MPSPKSNIIFGITGGIAAYKACELVRLFKKEGHNVRVVMTHEAERFVGALTLASLSGEPVLRSLHEGAPDLSATSHIDLARWGHLFIVAPATANFLAKYRAGIADDALLTEALAFQGPVLLAPAMNTRMWEAPITLENCAALEKRGVQFVGPDSGDLACGENGKGKMSDPEEIYAVSMEKLQSSSLLTGVRVLVTSGPTRSYIDSVRYITNRSSGKMGHALAKAAELLGAEVVLVTGPVEAKFAELGRGKVVNIERGQEMLSACEQVLLDADIVIAAAAVSDFQMPMESIGKIRREGNLQLDMIPSVDVLAELGKRKQENQVFMGFAAEAGAGEAEMQKGLEKMKRKNLDFLALNNILRKDIGFDADENEIVLFDCENRMKALPKKSKKDLARDLVLVAAQRFFEKKSFTQASNRAEV